MTEVVFSALVGLFIVKKMTDSGSYPYTQDSQYMWTQQTVTHLMNTIITGDESWVYGHDAEPVIFLIMKIGREY